MPIRVIPLLAVFGPGTQARAGDDSFLWLEGIAGQRAMVWVEGQNLRSIGSTNAQSTRMTALRYGNLGGMLREASSRPAADARSELDSRSSG
ncbi:MAG: hypothetical protein JJ992_27710 [Planctomycetes bacterium]|nr:hypothetical protein [Planctomycetota bacterium]